MKYIQVVFLSLVILLAVSCNSEDVELVNKWQLIEMLADPGDGSGGFEPVASDKVIEFWDDGTITSNGSICTMGSSTNASSNGTYNEPTMEIEVESCVGGHTARTYEIDADYLILNYPCIEPCREKYERVEYALALRNNRT
ncbi:MAG: hypothetical protein ACI9EQ_002249, partial [Bacteroidia bacterium]